MLQVAKVFSPAKNLVKNKIWIAFTDSGTLVIIFRVAIDLAWAYKIG